MNDGYIAQDDRAQGRERAQIGSGGGGVYRQYMPPGCVPEIYLYSKKREKFVGIHASLNFVPVS